MKKFAVALYSYFKKKKLPTPYFRTMMVLIGFIMLHLFAIDSVLRLPGYLNPFGMGKTQIVSWISGGIFIGIVYLILSLAFKKKYLEQYLITDRQRKNRLYILTIYSISLAVLIVLGAVFRFRNKG